MNLSHLPLPDVEATPSLDLGAGQILFQQGEKATSLFVVVSGRVRLERHTRGDRITSLGGMHVGSLLNPANLLTQLYEFDAVAEVPSRVAAYSLSVLSTLRTSEDPLTQWAVSNIVDRIRALETMIELRSISPARDRVLHYLLGQLLRDAPSSFGQSIVLDRRLKEIARDLGLSAEAFYRTLARLERDGALTRKKGRIDLHLNAA